MNEVGASMPPQRADATAPLQPSAADDTAALERMQADRDSLWRSPFWLTRYVYLRALGFIYVVAFSVLVQQMPALLGAHGLLPAARYVEWLANITTFREHPTLFWFDASDTTLRTASTVGLCLAIAAFFGLDHAFVWCALWALYLSFVHVGQIFYGYGWETLLLEAGFLAIFLAPMSVRASLREPARPPAILFVWLCWLTFRVMFGAGMIKLRGDDCWRDLTCLAHHYETQPVPHVLSRVLHAAPLWFQKLSVLFNHFVEVVVPFGLFLRRRFRHAAVGCIVAFQVLLIFSGNLAFLNWLTIAIALGCVDDTFWRKVLPRRVVQRAHAVQRAPSRGRIVAVAVYSCAVLVLSIEPALNLLSSRQQMNTSFEPLHLVNSYGAFGSIGRERDEVILEGTTDAQLTAATRWQAYEFKCKPGDVRRLPCWITPYHYRLDWQMWFAAMSAYPREPWLVHFVYKLLHGDRTQLELIAHNPFPNAPPRFIRAERYRYHYAAIGSGAFWRRERLGGYMPAFSSDDPRMLELLERYGLESH